MKKITLGIAALFAAFTMNAQNSCADALAVTDGTYTVDAVDGEGAPGCFPDQAATNAEWYTYTAGTEDALVTISSDLEVEGNADGDTRLSVFAGDESCGNFTTCLASNDDVSSGDAYQFLSKVQFLAEAGVTYYFVFDNYWSADGFDFEVSSTTDIPATPVAVSTPSPADGATDASFYEETNSQGTTYNTIDLSWSSSEDDIFNYRVDISEDSEFESGVIFAITFNSQASIAYIFEDNEQLIKPNTTYYWRVTPSKGAGSGLTLPTADATIWSFTTGTLGVDDFKTESLTHYVSNGLLNIDADQQLSQVTLYSILGNQVASQEVNNTNATIEISSLQSGVYLAQVQVEGKTKTFKFVKK